MKGRISIVAQLTRAVMCVSVLGITLTGCGSEDSGSNQPDGPGFFTAIHSQNVLDATLAFDLDSLIYYKEAGADNEVNGVFTIETGDSTLTVPVELRSRGVTRKNLCQFPPIRLQVKKSAVEANGWGPYRNYKLVTHCSDTAKIDDLLLREHMVYRLYQELTDYSFKTQLLKLKYVTNGEESQHYAFLIENVDELNDRLGLTELDVEATGLKRIHFDHYKRFALFQYMVMNTDWNLGSAHNTKFVLEEGSESPIVIPYDFDYCGMVNAPYARPYETLPIDSVRERYFMYRGKKDDDFTQVVEEFKAKRQAWTTIVNDCPQTCEKTKADMLKCLDSFFETIEQPDWKDKVFPS